MDWQCPYCNKILFDGGNKLRHLSSHEPCIRKLLRRNFLMKLELTFRVFDSVVSEVE